MGQQAAGYYWRCPAEPAAIALLSVSDFPALFDRALPEPGRARFALLQDAAGAVIDEVVLTRLRSGGLEIACHGGNGVREAVTAALRSHGLVALAQDPNGESALWQELATCVHPAAVLAHCSGAVPTWQRFMTRLPKVLITGPSNAGKSTLLNAWVGHQRALAGPIAGTTRDLLAAQVQCYGWNLEIIDSAGLRETSDVLEAAGQDLVAAAREWADVVIYCLPADFVGEQRHFRADDMVLRTKIDLHTAPAGGSALVWAAAPHVSEAQSAAYLVQLSRQVLQRLDLPVIAVYGDEVSR